MGSMTVTYGATSFAAMTAAAVCALLAALERFGTAPIALVQGTGAPAAAHAAHLKDVVARKADDRVPPRGRRL